MKPPSFTGTCCVNGDRRFLMHRQSRTGGDNLDELCVCVIESSVAFAHDMNQRTECPRLNDLIRHPIITEVAHQNLEI